MNKFERKQKQQQCEADGFNFVGGASSSEFDDEDVVHCPDCDSAETYVGFWEHPYRRRYQQTDSQYNPRLVNKALTCWECGYCWVEEEPQRESDQSR